MYVPYYASGRAGRNFINIFLVLSACALVVWVYSVLPSSSHFTSSVSFSFSCSRLIPLLVLIDIDRLAERIPQYGSFPPDLKKSTLEIATKNLVCSVALTGVMLLQAGRQTSENKDTSPDHFLISAAKVDASALDDEVSSLPDLDYPEMPRGRRRSHHDHLEAELDSASTASSTPSLRSEGSLKRDGSRRKRKSLAGVNRAKVTPRAGEASVKR